ncbi:(2Fe-2S)-binding protein [Amycolatopsis thermoflava]|uniref:(2Fe-2S)-binding protein n=1 Tax=Amycolatopsis thermoflava TaxID=84480 RepID=UPI003F4A7B54
MTAVPATAITDRAWLSAQLRLAAGLYGEAGPVVLGTIWWYSVSAVLVTPALDPLVATGRAMDPALEAVTLDVVSDGRVLDARSSRPLGSDVDEIGKALAGSLDAGIAAVAEVSGAGTRALCAIATDSIANVLLWAGKAAGDVARGVALAEPVVAAVGDHLPRPRFVEVGGTPVVRRASCCLIYRTGGAPKCVSCPRQTPSERAQRLRMTFG